MPPPLYRSIAHNLREKISSNVYPPGAQLPPEPELMHEWGVSRNTIRLAIGALANEGLVTAQPGRGTFVRDRTPVTVIATQEEGADPSPEAATHVSAISLQGRQPFHKFELLSETADAEVAERLRIPAGSVVIVRRLYRYIGDDPWSLQDTRYPADIASGTELALPRIIDRGAIQALRDLGHDQVGYRDEILARMPDQPEADFMRLATGTPVIELRRTAFSVSRPIRLTTTVYPSDRNRLVYEENDVRAFYAGETASG